MSGFTPGPWVFSHRESIHGGYRTEIYTEDGEVVATAAWYPRKLNETTTTTDREANARLIAAAPELLAALSALVPMVAEWHTELPEHVGDNEGPALASARAAIAKATQP